MPTTTPGTHPFEQARLAARELARHAGADRHDVLVVLGTGLRAVAPLLGVGDSPIDLTSLPWSPRSTGLGNRPVAWSLPMGTQRVLVVAGRLHLHEGRTPAEVVHVVRTALAGGCRTVLLTGSAGAVRRDLAAGQVVAVSDHLNLTATSPLAGIAPDHLDGTPYVTLADAWSARLRALARGVEPSLAEGVYAQVPGPHLETPAEVRMLATLGADLVGMSMVPEAIAACHLGAEVLGLVVATGPADGTPAAIAGASEEVARLVSGVVARLDGREP